MKKRESSWLTSKANPQRKAWDSQTQMKGKNFVNFIWRKVCNCSQKYLKFFRERKRERKKERKKIQTQHAVYS